MDAQSCYSIRIICCVCGLYAGSLPLTGTTLQYTAGSAAYSPADGLSITVPPVTASVRHMPDVTHAMATDVRAPLPPAPVSVSSLPMNLSSQASVPSSLSGADGRPPPPPTEGFVPSHGIVTATPGKVSKRDCGGSCVTVTVEIALITTR